jgi:pyruvate dehydrogenase E1 component beta subunit
MVEAIREAIREEMRRDPSVILMGEDVGKFGGTFRVAEGLIDEFGSERVRDTPISEAAFTGAGLGAAVTGLRPIVEIMFGDFLMVAADQVFNQAAKIRYMFGGKARAPLVIRTTMGAGRSSAAQHSQSIHAWACHIPGIKVVLPSNPFDAKGLLKTAIRDDNPVIFFEHKMMYRVTGEVPEEEYAIPFGQASVNTQGDDVTVVATGAWVAKSVAVARRLAQEGVGVEVIDPRTLVPYDRETVAQSVTRTGRLVIADEGHESFGISGEIAFRAMEDCFYSLKAPIKRVCAPDVPVPFSPALEKYMVANEEAVEKAIRGVLVE